MLDRPARPLRVLFAAAEAFPLVKTGGLGDVAGALPRALAAAGADVRMVMPGYPQATRSGQPFRAAAAFERLLGRFPSRLLATRLAGSDLPLWLVDCPELYNREGSPYRDATGRDWADNHLRFAAFAQAVARIAEGPEMAVGGWRPDIVHLNDWHCGLAPNYLRGNSRRRPGLVFTIHNLAYQGLAPAEALSALDLSPDDFTPAGCEFWGKISFLKAGLVGADRITTVSPTYAREIQSAPAGFGLEGVISSRARDLIGILNGIDDRVWNPATDALIARPYTVDTLPDKAGNTAAVRQMFALEPELGRPLIGLVSRLVEQKGIDVLLAAMPGVIAAGAQVACLGEGDTLLQSRLQAMADIYPGRVGVRIAFDEATAHLLTAGCDLLVLPSRFEPCGMTQLYGQRYGTLPVVHRVGGLADTVTDGVDGFTFDGLTPERLVTALTRAANVLTETATWRRIQRQAMAKSLSWRPCAARYLDLYDDLLRGLRL